MLIKWRSESSLDLYKLALGGFLFVSPWLFAFAYSPARLDAWVGGLILMAASVAALVAFKDWEEWLTLALGLWLIAAPWLLGLPSLATKVHVGVGLICAYLAALELWFLHYHDPEDRQSHH
jgi:hypothetical protein